MSLAVRPASAAVADDRLQMMDLLGRNLPNIQDWHFEWRHFANPAGPAWSWFLYEKPGGAVVGMASVLPRFMLVDGKPVVCGQVFEFVVDAGYRSLGPAVMLQRATFGPVDSGAIPICFDCPPHDQGMSTFDRLGMRAVTEVDRYALPLRSDAFLQKKLGVGPLAKPAIAAANLLLRIKLSSRRAQRMPGIEISQFDGDFGDEFTQLDRSVSSLGLIRASRLAEDLNWRYRHSRSTFRTLIARRSGELVGFLIAIDFDGRVTIWDLFGHQFDEVGGALIDALVDLCRKKNASLVEGYSSEGSPLRGALLEAGFTRRERLARIVAYEKPDSPAGRMLHPGIRWAFTLVEPGLS